MDDDVVLGGVVPLWIVFVAVWAIEVRNRWRP